MNQKACPHTAATKGATDHPEPFHRLFCYGTLQIPAVLEAVIGHRLQGMRTVLPGYAACQIRRAEYPGLVRSPGDKTSGRLYSHVTRLELDVLDRFEGRLYRRQHKIVIKASGQRTQAWVYMVAPGKNKQVTKRPWHLDRFMRTDYHRFMRRFVMGRRIFYTEETVDDSVWNVPGCKA